MEIKYIQVATWNLDIGLEKKMVELAAKNSPFVKKEISKSDAISYFTDKGDEYKLDLLSGLQDGEITFYTQGEFTDLCRGPHIPHTGLIKAIKLTSIAGAYWKGDSKNEMLQRIYGTAWRTTKELEKTSYEIRHYEPLMALDGGVDGLNFYRDFSRKINNIMNKKPRRWFN